MKAEELTVGQYFKTSDTSKSWKFKVLPKDAKHPNKIIGQVVIDNFHTSQARIFDLHDNVSVA
jgi:hypothetical protein